MSVDPFEMGGLDLGELSPGQACEHSGADTDDLAGPREPAADQRPGGREDLILLADEAAASAAGPA